MRDFSNDQAWAYYRFGGRRGMKGIKEHTFFESRGGEGDEEIFELIVRPTWPTLSVPGNRPDGCYGTRDVFLRHPTIEDAYKFLGRLDDTLVHVSGEKTNPVVSRQDSRHFAWL